MVGVLHCRGGGGGIGEGRKAGGGEMGCRGGGTARTICSEWYLVKVVVVLEIQGSRLDRRFRFIGKLLHALQVTLRH